MDSTKKFHPNIDIRGRSGYIIWPNSINADGKEYTVSVKGNPATLPPSLKAELVRLGKKKASASPSSDFPKKGKRADVSMPDYVKGVVHQLITTISEATVGTRNDTLNRAFSTGKWVACGALSKEGAQELLFDAADDCSLVSDDGGDAVRKTIESGLTAGMGSGENQAEAKHLVCLELDEFCERTVPPREMLIDPILPKQGLMMIGGIRGGAKTYLAMTLGLAAASGINLFADRWTVPRPVGVLYIDGEMAASDFQQRAIALQKGLKCSSTNFHVITPDFQEQGMPNLATLEGQLQIEPYLEGLALS